MISFEYIENPQKFFDKENFRKISEVVRNGFGSDMNSNDIYNHLTTPEKVYLIREDFEVIGMAAVSSLNLDSEDVTYLEGIVIDSHHQKKDISGKFLREVLKEKYIVGKTQNPNMYRCIEKNYSKISPGKSDPKLEKIKNLFSREIGLETDELGVVRNCYGKCLYNQIPENNEADLLFNKILRLNYQKGDSLLFAGVR